MTKSEAERKRLEREEKEKQEKETRAKKLSKSDREKCYKKIMEESEKIKENIITNLRTSLLCNQRLEEEVEPIIVKRTQEFIAKNIVKNNPYSVNDKFYGDWIKGYISDSYSAENIVLLEEINRLTENYTEKQIQHLVDIFTSCSRYELAFWDMAWNMSK